jgi:hypothetical protein
VELYLQSPNTPSWRGAVIKHRDNFTFTFIIIIIIVVVVIVIVVVIIIIIIIISIELVLFNKPAGSNVDILIFPQRAFNLYE